MSLAIPATRCRETLLTLLAVLLFATVTLPSVTHGQENATEREDPLRHFTPHVFENGSDELLYRWMAPANADAPDSEPYPLVLFLHGAGERGDNNRSQLIHGAGELASDERRRSYPAYALFPQCPKGLRWVETDWTTAKGQGTFPTKASKTLDLTLKLVDRILAGKEQHANIDPDRIYITGLSMGGYGTWHATSLKPNLFAASAVVCGGGDPALVPSYAKSLPIWAFHGDADNVVPLERGREIVDALNQAGQSPTVRFTVYPGVNHNSWTPTYQNEELYQWMFRQRRGQPSADRNE